MTAGLRVVLLAALVSLAYGFSDTQPLIAWSSQRSNALDSLSSAKSLDSHTLLESILFNDDVCAHDAVVLVEQPGLRASDLRVLEPSSGLVKAIDSASSSIQFPYVRQSSTSLLHFADHISARCGSRVVGLVTGQDSLEVERGSKYVFHVNIPTLEGDFETRMGSMTDYESHTSTHLGAIAVDFPNHLIIFTGSMTSFGKRQAAIDEDNRAVFAPNGTDPVLPKGGILKRYQLLTPALITSLLIVFFLLIPIVLMGVSAMASIQSPLRSEIPKGYNAHEKKNQ